MRKRDQAVLAALVIGLLIGAAAIYNAATSTFSPVASPGLTSSNTILNSTTTVTPTVLCPSGMVCGSFSYSPTGQVAVESVEANYSANQSGPAAVTFWVTFENLGNSLVSFPAYALNASVATNSSALREIFPRNFGGGITVGTSPLSYGQSYTLFSPYSGDNYNFLLVQGGTVDVNLNFTWDAGQLTQCANPPCPFQALSSSTTVIAAQFTFEAPTQNPSAVTGIVVPSSSASAVDPHTGLSLNLDLSTNSNGWLIVTTYEFNTLDRANNVSRGTGLNSSFFQYVENNCEGGGIDGYEILQGNYGLNNFTSGTALWLQPHQTGMQCGTTDTQISYYAFMPLSNQSVISGTYLGSWTDPSDDSTYHPFAPGIYTVVAGDEWGDYAILHFEVPSAA